MNSNNFLAVVDKIFPALSGSSVTYNAARNIYLTSGYQSLAGNVYFQGLRLTDRIIINYDFGQGYKYLFLNGICIYGFDGKEKKIIASRSFNSYVFSEKSAALDCIEMIKEYIKGEMKMLDMYVDDSQIQNFCETLIIETIPVKLLS